MDHRENKGIPEKTSTSALLMILKILTVCITTNWKILKETGISDHLTSIRFSHPVMSGSLQSHRLQHTRLPCPAPTHGAYSNLSIELVMCIDLVMCIELVMPSNHLISVVRFSSCLQSVPASGSFPVSQFFESGGQNIGASISPTVPPVNIQLIL